MDEHKPQEQAPEKVPARRKAAECAAGRRSILPVTCILVTLLVTSMIFVGNSAAAVTISSRLKFAWSAGCGQKTIGDADDTAISDGFVERDHQRHR